MIGDGTAHSGLLKSFVQVLRDGRMERSREFTSVDFPITSPDKGFHGRQTWKIYPYFASDLQPGESLHSEACGREVGQGDFKGRPARFAKSRGRRHACPLRSPPLRLAIIAPGFALSHGLTEFFSRRLDKAPRRSAPSPPVARYT